MDNDGWDNKWGWGDEDDGSESSTEGSNDNEMGRSAFHAESGFPQNQPSNNRIRSDSGMYQNYQQGLPLGYQKQTERINTTNLHGHQIHQHQQSGQELHLHQPGGQQLHLHQQCGQQLHQHQQGGQQLHQHQQSGQHQYNTNLNNQSIYNQHNIPNNMSTQLLQQNCHANNFQYTDAMHSSQYDNTQSQNTIPCDNYQYKNNNFGFGKQNYINTEPNFIPVNQNQSQEINSSFNNQYDSTLSWNDNWDQDSWMQNNTSIMPTHENIQTNENKQQNEPFPKSENLYQNDNINKQSNEQSSVYHQQSVAPQTQLQQSPPLQTQQNYEIENSNKSFNELNSKFNVFSQDNEHEHKTNESHESNKFIENENNQFVGPEIFTQSITTNGSYAHLHNTSLDSNYVNNNILTNAYSSMNEALTNNQHVENTVHDNSLNNVEDHLDVTEEKINKIFEEVNQLNINSEHNRMEHLEEEIIHSNENTEMYSLQSSGPNQSYESLHVIELPIIENYKGIPILQESHIQELMMAPNEIIQPIEKIDLFKTSGTVNTLNKELSHQNTLHSISDTNILGNEKIPDSVFERHDPSEIVNDADISINHISSNVDAAPKNINVSGVENLLANMTISQYITNTIAADDSVNQNVTDLILDTSIDFVKASDSADTNVVDTDIGPINVPDDGKDHTVTLQNGDTPPTSVSKITHPTDLNIIDQPKEPFVKGYDNKPIDGDKKKIGRRKVPLGDGAKENERNVSTSISKKDAFRQKRSLEKQKTSEERNQFLETGQLEERLASDDGKTDGDGNEDVAPSFVRMITGSETNDQQTNNVKYKATSQSENKSTASTSSKSNKNHVLKKSKKHRDSYNSDSNEMEPEEEEDDEILEDKKLRRLIKAISLLEGEEDPIEDKTLRRMIKAIKLSEGKTTKKKTKSKDMNENKLTQRSKTLDHFDSDDDTVGRNHSLTAKTRTPNQNDNPNLSHFEIYMNSLKKSEKKVTSPNQILSPTLSSSHRDNQNLSHFELYLASKKQNERTKPSMTSSPLEERSYTERKVTKLQNSAKSGLPQRINQSNNGVNKEKPLVERRKPKKSDNFQSYLPFLSKVLSSFPNVPQEDLAQIQHLSLSHPVEYKDWFNAVYLPALEQYRLDMTAKTFLKSKNKQNFGRHSLGKMRLNSILKFDHSKVIEQDIRRDRVCYVTGDEEYMREIELLTPFTFDNEDKKCFYAFIQSMIQKTTNQSEKLLYQLIGLIFNSKGEVELSDIGELLLKEKGSNMLNYPPPAWSPNNDEDVKIKLRSLLINAQKEKALKYALNNNELALATVLAYKTDGEAAMNEVRQKFLNTFSANDPLRTCFQTLFKSNIEMTSTTYQNDWNIHLAAILNNSNASNIDTATILKLGRDLGEKGDIYAEQFCYISMGCPIDIQPRFKLLGTNLDNNIDDAVTAKHILLTMTYENASKLRPSPDYQFVSLQYMKYYFALKLLKRGKTKIALCFLQHASVEICSHVEYFSNIEHISLLTCIYDIATKSERNPDVCWIQQLNNTMYEIKRLNYLSIETVIPYDPPRSESTLDVLTNRNQRSRLDSGQYIQTSQEYGSYSRPGSVQFSGPSSGHYSGPSSSQFGQYTGPKLNEYGSEVHDVSKSEFNSSAQVPALQNTQDSESSASMTTNTIQQGYSFAKEPRDGNGGYPTQSVTNIPPIGRKNHNGQTGIQQPMSQFISHPGYSTSQQSMFMQPNSSEEFQGTTQYYQPQQVSYSRSSSPASSLSKEVRYYTSRRPSWNQYKYANQ